MNKYWRGVLNEKVKLYRITNGFRYYKTEDERFIIKRDGGKWHIIDKWKVITIKEGFDTLIKVKEFLFIFVYCTSDTNVM